MSSKLARAEAAILASPNIRSLAEIIVSSMVEVRQGTLEPNRANAVSSLARSLLASMQAASEAERVARLEALIDKVASQREYTVDDDVEEAEYEVVGDE